MRSFKRLRPSPAMIVATIALFVALGGAAYAGFSLPNNSVRSNHIANGQVKSGDLANLAVTRAKIANNAVNSGKVTDGGLEITDLSAAAQAALRGATGAAGAAGPAGPAGPSEVVSFRDTSILNLVGGLSNPVASLNLQAGSYAVTSKFVAQNDLTVGPPTITALSCTLSLGGVTDAQTIRLELGGGANSTDDREVVTNVVTATLAAPGAATLSCTPTSGNSTVDVEDLWVVATKVGTLTHTTG